MGKRIQGNQIGFKKNSFVQVVFRKADGTAYEPSEKEKKKGNAPL